METSKGIVGEKVNNDRRKGTGATQSLHVEEVQRKRKVPSGKSLPAP